MNRHSKLNQKDISKVCFMEEEKDHRIMEVKSLMDDICVVFVLKICKIIKSIHILIF